MPEKKAKPLFKDVHKPAKGQPQRFLPLFAPWQIWELDGDALRCVVVKPTVREIKLMTEQPGTQKEPRYKVGEIWNFEGLKMKIVGVYSRMRGKQASIHFRRA